MSEIPSAADASIAAGDSLSKLRLLWGSKEQAFRYYAQAMAAQHAVAEGACGCGAAPELTARFTWRAIYNTRFAPSAVDALLLLAGVFRLRTTSSVMEFATHHACCRRCWRKMLWKRGLANVLHFWSLFAGLITGTGAAVFLCLFLYTFGAANLREERTLALLTGLGCAAAFGLCVGAFFLANRLRVPMHLRRIPRFPFRFERVDRQQAAT